MTSDSEACNRLPLVKRRPYARRFSKSASWSSLISGSGSSSEPISELPTIHSECSRLHGFFATGLPTYRWRPS